MTDLPDEQKNPSVVGSSVSKEREFPSSRENIQVVEVGHVPETEAEKEGYVERIEKSTELKQPVLDDQGQVLVTSPVAQQPQIVLPVSQSSYLNPKNWHRPVVDSFRWLLTWTQRIVKMHPQEAVFENDTNS